MKKGIVVFLASLGLALTANHASAQLVVYDGMNYTVGANLDGQSGGTGNWAGNWGQFGLNGSGYSITSGGLTDPTSTLLVSGNKASTTKSAGFEGRYNNAAPGGQGAAGTTNFWSILIRPDDLGTATGLGSTNGGFILQLFNNTGNGDLAVGKSGDNANWGLEHNGLGSFSSVAAVSNVTAFLVLEEDFTAGADTFKLFVNPTPGAAEPVTPAATLSYDIGTQNGFGLNTFNGAAASYDEIRMGTTYASVTPVAVPEPSTVALVAGSLVTLLGYRFRRGNRRG